MQYPRIALAMSGGGFRAALFHLGSLTRLNELGVLTKLATISGVSGGSLVAAHLATWFDWPMRTVISQANWTAFADELHAFAARDQRTVAMGLGAVSGIFERRYVRAQSIIRAATSGVQARTGRWSYVFGIATAELMAARFESLGHMRGRRLSSLPRKPEFLIRATDLTFAEQFDFSRDHMGDTAAGYVSTTDHDPAIALAVAASACFPPVVRPMQFWGPHVSKYKGGSAPASLKGAHRAAAL
jgi:NTE family protein